MFKIISIDISGIPEANKLIDSYAEAVTSKDINARETDNRQRILEKYVANKLGAKLVNGKIGQKQSVDYLVPGNSSLIKALYADLQNNQDIPVEFKGATTSGGVTIGRITIGDQKSLESPSEINPFTAKSIKQNVLGKRLGGKEGYLVDLDPNLSEATDKSAYIFDNYFKKDKRLLDLFYNKASTMLLANNYYLNDTKGSRLIGLVIPKKYFTSAFFKATIVDKAIVVSIKDNFQNNFIKDLNQSYLEVNKAKKGYKKSFTIGGKVYKIDYLPVIKGSEVFSMEITNSIKSRPIDTFILRAELPKKAKEKPKPQKFISGAQWTYLVQQRLGESMLNFGNPEPPDLKERSGRFRRSITISANYKTKIIQYTYNPLYRALEHYGYHPELQIERSIKSVAQDLYAREFNILRKGTLA